MRILIITQKIDKNDAILGFFCGWLNELARRVEKIYVLALEKKDADLDRNIELCSLGKENGSNRLERFVKFNYYLAKILLKKRVDIAFVLMCPEYLLLTSHYAKLSGIPVVMWYAHGCVNMRLLAASLLANKILSSSKEGFRLKSRKLTIIGQGIDVEKFKAQTLSPKTANEKKLILSAGRISPIKNFELLIKAADILINHKGLKNLGFQIVGAVPLKSQNRYLGFLKKLVKQQGLQDYVQFLGPVPYTQIQNAYYNCDLLVSTSNTGSLDKVVLEAMACAKPILTSSEAFANILDGHAQMLVFEKNNALALAEKITSILAIDEEPYQELGEKLREIVVKGHSLGEFAEKVVRVFQEI